MGLLGSLFGNGAPAAVGPRQGGLAGFINGVINPTNPLGQLGKYLTIASGSQLGDAWGAIDQDNRQAQAAQLQRQYALADRQEQRAYEEQNWRDHQQYQMDHPNPTSLQQDYKFLSDINPSLGQSYLENKANPTQFVTADNGDGTKTIVPVPRSGVPGTMAPRQGMGTLPPGFTIRGGAPSQGGATFPAAMNALIQQESGGRAGAVGPQTRYGRAFGMTQMLPDTAKGVAASMGVPYRADLLSGKDEASAAYQRALGQAYLAEGLRNTGNLRDAFRYYHGGPNRRMWGPKTDAYADAVLARMGG